MTSTIDVAGLAKEPEDVLITIDIDHSSKQDLIVALHQPAVATKCCGTASRIRPRS